MKRFSRILAMMAMQAWLFMPGLFAQNLLNNGSFESGQVGWTGWGSTLTVTTANPQEGNHSARFTAGSTLEQTGISLDTGQQYKLSFWLRINGMAGNDWGGIRIAVISMDWTEWHHSDFFTVNNRPTGQWFNEVISVQPTVSPVRVQVQFFGGGGWTSYDFQIDNMVLFEDVPVNSPPVIQSFSVTPVTGTVPFTVTGSVVASDPDGVVQNYVFDMGDGAVYSGSSTFQHTYRVQGEYTIRVTVADDEGATAYDTVHIIALGTSPHQIQVTHPPGAVYTTSFDTINIQGIRQHGAGDIFWVNHRTGQSGFEPVGTNHFSINNLALGPGSNQIHIQSASGTGQYVMTMLDVVYQPVGYNGPVISNITANNTQVTQYERTDIHFDIATVADNLSFPYDPSMPANLQTGSGISVDMEFTQGAISLTQPAFLDMGYTRIGDVLVPSGEKRWTVRMAFADTGIWNSQIIARDTMGITILPGPTFTVLPDPEHDGYLRVSQSDNRYFEYDSGKPFIPVGHGTSAATPDITDQEIAAWSANGVNFGRFWLSSASPFSDPWSSWATHHTMANNGYMPPPLLTSSQKFGNGQFSYRIAAPAIPNVNTPAIFRGFWEKPIAVEPSSTYRVIARVKTVDVTGGGGLVLKMGTWLDTQVTNPGIGTTISPYATGDNGWFYLVGVINTHATQHTLDYLYLVLEDAVGEAFLDQLTIQKLHPNGSLDQNILPKWNANTHQYLDPIKSKEADYMIEEANNHGIHYKVVIHEKGDYIKNHIDQAGLPSSTHGNFDQPENTPLHRLYQYYWRNLIARWGYATAIHSWELVNEGAPGSYMNLTNDLFNYFVNHSPYHRMTSTSFWSEWMPQFWQDVHSDYGNVHAYIMTTGFIDTVTIDGILYNRQQLQRDAAAAVYAYAVHIGTDPARTKPVVIGETDLDQPGNQEPDPLLSNDTAGVWLHNFIWAHINHGGVPALIWDPLYIRMHDLYPRYRNFRAFMEGIPLQNGRYGAVTATASDPMLRVWGQMDQQEGQAHFWVQNRQHTWHRVTVENIQPVPITSIITIGGFNQGDVEVEWWDPWDSLAGPYHIDTMTINASGDLELNIVNLQRDLAFRIRMLDVLPPAAPARDWAQHQQNASRTGRTAVSVAPPYRTRWIWAGPQDVYRNAQSEPGWSDNLTSSPGYSFPIPNQVNFTIAGGVQPIIKGHRLYFGTMDGDAYALDMRDGTTLWNAPIPGGTITSAGVLEDVALFFSVRGVVHAFDTLTGNQLWSYNTRGALTAPPAIMGNSVVVANNKGKITRLDATGNILWERELLVPVVGGIAAAGNRVYVPAEDMVVYALNFATGHTEASRKVIGQSFRMCHPVFYDGRVYITSVPIPMTGSEYVMEEVMMSSTSIQDEEDNIRQWLQGNTNGGAWPDASTDWQHFFVLDHQTLADLYLVPSGPVDGCGYPPPAPVVDMQGNVIKWWKTRYPTLTTSGNVFGTNYSIDLAAINPTNGNRVALGNGLSNFWLLETDNLYGLSVGGDYLWARQNFRGTACIRLTQSLNSFRLVQVTTRINDGGDFSGADIYYRESNQWNGYLSQPYLVTQPRTHSRVAPAIAGEYVFISEEFGIVAIENY